MPLHSQADAAVAGAQEKGQPLPHSIPLPLAHGAHGTTAAPFPTSARGTYRKAGTRGTRAKGDARWGAAVTDHVSSEGLGQAATEKRREAVGAGDRGVEPAAQSPWSAQAVAVRCRGLAWGQGWEWGTVAPRHFAL